MSPIKRFLLFIFVLIFVLLLPWWLSGIALLFLTIYIPFYPEVIFFGFLIDVIYSTGYAFPSLGLLIATVVFIVILYLRPYIRIQQF